jgi:general secretion pathway protein F
MRYDVQAKLGSMTERLEVEADSPADLERRVSEWGMTLITASPARTRQRLLLFGRKPSFDRTLFTQELIALQEAGLSLIETIETLRDKATGLSRQVLDGIASALYEGQPLSRAVEQQPEVFPPLYVATIASAEKSGHLAEALKRYHVYDAKLAAVRKKVVSALIYPLMVIAVGGLILLFLLFYVIPKFSQIYESMADLPPAARVMLWWGDLVRDHGFVLITVIVAALVAGVLALRGESTREKVMEYLWRIPLLQRYRRLFALTGFYRTMGLLLSGGMPMLTALQLSQPLLSPKLRGGLGEAIDVVKSGQPLSFALHRTQLTTPVADRLLRVGEQSGDLGRMMTHAAEFSDDELDRALDALMKLVEPVLMLIVGGLIGVIVFLLYMPIFELAGNVG